jgi:hypothetical protein
MATRGGTLPKTAAQGQLAPNGARCAAAPQRRDRRRDRLLLRAAWCSWPGAGQLSPDRSLPLDRGRGPKSQNWMGAPGAWAAERGAVPFGLVGVLLLPLLYVSARKLWRGEEERRDAPALRPALVAADWPAAVRHGADRTMLSLPSPGRAAPCPRMGGLSGLLGAGAIGHRGRLPARRRRRAGRSLARRCPAWPRRGAGRAGLRDRLGQPADLPGFLAPIAAHLPAACRAGRDALPSTKRARAKRRKAPAPPAAGRVQRSSRPRRRPKSAIPIRAGQAGALSPPAARATCSTPSSCPASTCWPIRRRKAPKLDKLALERNARLLETVLDDFNVKGEITAVRTGPVVTMYELEPAPGIKASRVIGLAEDIARNMSAISGARLLHPRAHGDGHRTAQCRPPDGDRFKELAPARRSPITRACCRSSWARTSPASRSSPTSPPCRTCWSRAPPVGQVGRAQLHPAVAALPPDPGEVPPDPDRSQGAGTQELRRYPAPALARGDRAGQGRARAEMGGRGNGAALPHDERDRRSRNLNRLQREGPRRRRQGQAAGPPHPDRLRSRYRRGALRGSSSITSRCRRSC